MTAVRHAPSVTVAGMASPTISKRFATADVGTATEPTIFMCNHMDGPCRVSITKVDIEGDPIVETQSVSQSIGSVAIQAQCSLDGGDTWQVYKTFNSLGEFNELFMAMSPLQWRFALTALSPSSYIRLRVVPLCPALGG